VALAGSGEARQGGLVGNQTHTLPRRSNPLLPSPCTACWNSVRCLNYDIAKGIQKGDSIRSPRQVYA